MNITPYITYLLFHHDCVIVPGLGGFLARYEEAFIDYSTNKIYPPVRKVGFNASLKNNDGLLANFIAREQHVSFEDSCRIINQWVQTCNSLLNAQEVEIPFLGNLKSVQNRIEFFPLANQNFLVNTYSLPAVSAKFISKVNKNTCSDESEVFSTVTTSNKGSRFWVYAAAAVAILVLLGGIFTYNFVWKNSTMISSIDTSSVFPIKSKEIVIKRDTQLVNPRSTENASVLPAEISSTEIPTESNKIETSLDFTKEYYIIIGAFKKKSNLKRAETKIKSEFNSSEIYTEVKDGITKVGFKAGLNESEANLTLTQAKKIQSDCWLYVLDKN